MDLFSSPSKVKIEYIYFHLRAGPDLEWYDPGQCGISQYLDLGNTAMLSSLSVGHNSHLQLCFNLPGDAKINESQASVPSHKVTERPDGTFQCSCMKWTQSGKTCKHILAVIMQEQFVSVEEYHKLETICAKCGKQAAGIFSNPKKVEKGQHSQARTDATVQSELDAVLQMFEKKGCGNPFAQEDWCMKGITNTGACTSSDAKPDENSGFNLNASLYGQPAEVQPLHLGHSKNAQNPQKNTQKKNTKLVFNGKKGPKAKQKIHPNSLLMAGPEQIH
ncbi:hypothetical protein D9758_006597 [Tetrapyrgos nigripes]|uniref:SWIM-type domain-containing protein n=1 Tax=Tetrapyrgos nigripes TaxID=182062 RepID=A0A8H5LQT6_9AGAR|nr:hypothetical protein D9758_006597 [Tetrapyrgos nigripes]